MAKVLEKVERRLGEKLFLKGERCAGPKCAVTRRPYPPGAHGKAAKRGGRRGGGSQFAVELREKQKVRYLYGLREAMLRRYFEEALRDKKHPTGDALINMLEKRLDNVMFRAGLAPSRNTARHLVSYGHVLVNGRAVNKPSYIVRKGDVVELKQKSSSNDKILTETQKAMLKKFAAPLWMKFNVDDLKIEIVSQPYDTDLRIDPKMRSVVEFYSR
ncbi:MAG: 30S ribosomal protein S4 [Candidatus Sungbacteria bacterium RIFCSPHIGHO2_02_FULL_46_12]|nr:MAG: 30S ribosomal protein S4 [Candidatus Sungbacteria bacterium RIFCSPHIGHO2_02_FULL_46_12]